MESGDHLLITLPSGAAFLKAYDPRGVGRYTVRSPEPGLFPASATVGATVVVELDFLDSEMRFRHHARITERADDWITLEFLPEEPQARELILGHASGEAIPYVRRRKARSAVSIPVMLLVGDTWRRGALLDLSEHGAHVELVDPPPAWVRVVLALVTARGRLEIPARTVYQKVDGPRRGCGLEFQFSAREEADLAAAEIRVLLKAAGRGHKQGPPPGRGR